MRVPEKYYDEVFEFAGQWDVISKCGLKIIDKGEKKVVVVTELYQDNPGSSVTAAAGLLAAQICARKGLKMEEVIYLECNPDTHSKLSFYDEEYFQVTFTEVGGKWVQPKYRQLSAEEVKALLS